MRESAEEKQLLKCVEIGIEFEVFRQSAVGREMIRRARCHAEEYLEQLKTVDPTDAKRIREIQTEIWRGESFGLFIEELINDGRQAAEVLKAPEE